VGGGLELLGMARQAQECYEQALRLSPGDGETLYRLARLLAQVGHYERSIDYLRRAVKHAPEHRAARDLLAENYGSLGLAGQAEVLSPTAREVPPSSGPRYFPPSISDKDTALFLRLFSGREVGYAIQYVDTSTGELSYRYVEAPLTHDPIVSHLLGEITLAAYPLRLDNTASFTAVAAGIPSRILQANLKNQGYLIHLEDMARQHVLRLAAHARGLGLPAYPEDSGIRRFRLWFFFEEPVHFLRVRRFVLSFLEGAPRPEGCVAVEPVLATKPVGIGWVERPVVLPLGVQRSTLRRSLFLDADGTPHGEQLKYLRKIRHIPAKAVRDLDRGLPADQGQRKAGTEAMLKPVRILAGRCAPVREILERALSGRVLRREEKVILFYTIGLADRDGESLHRVLENFPDYDHDKVRRQAERLQPHPVSCLKIRELVPELTASVPCNCAFDLRGGKYPSPLIHVNPHLVPTSDELAAPEGPALRDSARRYVNLRRRAEEIDRALARLEVVLESHCSRKGIQEIRIEGARLRRVNEQGRTRWELEAN
jgi:hypothetical protein